jgi:hypothetical protein
MMTTMTISQETHLPSRKLIESMMRLTASKACTMTESPSIPALKAHVGGQPGLCDS